MKSETSVCTKYKSETVLFTTVLHFYVNVKLYFRTLSHPPTAVVKMCDTVESVISIMV